MTILRGAHMLPDLTQVLLAQASLDRRSQALDSAEHRVEEAIAIASSRRMALHFADGLVLRGRLHLDRARAAKAEGDDTWRRRAEQALDDADDARTLAQRCGYAWAERDAAALRADAYTMLGDRERAHAARQQAEQLTRRLQPST